MTELCSLLQWDSEFFGVRIARLRDGRLDETTAHEVGEWCSRQRVDCLYFLADPNDATTVLTAEQAGYHLVDLRLVLEHSLTKPNHQPEIIGETLIRPSSPNDLPLLIPIAESSYTDSRFYHDEHFPRKKCSELYQVWLQRSIAGELADLVWMGIVGGVPSGFVTCKIEPNSRTAVIGLVGVGESARGSGLGKAMIGRALLWFGEQGCQIIEVVTQGRNIAAQRLYQASGFRTKSLNLWYHKWWKR